VTAVTDSAEQNSSIFNLYISMGTYVTMFIDPDTSVLMTTEKGFKLRKVDYSIIKDPAIIPYFRAALVDHTVEFLEGMVEALAMDLVSDDEDQCSDVDEGDKKPTDLAEQATQNQQKQKQEHIRNALNIMKAESVAARKRRREYEASTLNIVGNTKRKTDISATVEESNKRQKKLEEEKTSVDLDSESSSSDDD